MSLGPRTVHTMSLLAALGGLGAIVVTAPWTNAEAMFDTVVSEARGAFAEEPWSYAPWAALAGMGLAGFMSIVERIAMRHLERQEAMARVIGQGHHRVWAKKG